MKITNSSRLLALATAGVLSAGVLLQPAPARADKAKTYKYGAIALGAVGAYMLSKGKTVVGAAALGAGAYAYKKGEDTRKADKTNDYRYGYNNNGNRYGYNNGNRYGDNGGYNNGANYDYNNGGRYSVPDRNRLSDRDADYRVSRNDDRYRNDRDERRDYRANNSKIRVR